VKAEEKEGAFGLALAWAESSADAPPSAEVATPAATSGDGVGGGGGAGAGAGAAGGVGGGSGDCRGWRAAADGARTRTLVLTARHADARRGNKAAPAPCRRIFRF